MPHILRDLSDLHAAYATIEAHYLAVAAVARRMLACENLPDEHRWRLEGHEMLMERGLDELRGNDE